MNDFNKQLEWSTSLEGDEMFESVYRQFFPYCVKIEKVTDLPRQKKGLDKIVHTYKEGFERQISIDEKKRTKWYGDILLEIYKNDNTMEAGWARKTEAEFIAYAVVPIQKVYMLPMELVRKWVFDHWETIRKVIKEMRQINEISYISALNSTYRTISIAVKPDLLMTGLRDLMTQNVQQKTTTPQKETEPKKPTQESLGDIFEMD